MWILDGSTTAPTISVGTDLWHSFLVFISMWLASHLANQTSGKNQ